MSRLEQLVLEIYLESLDSGEIRVKGTRVGIEIVLRDYLQGAGPEEIVLRYSTLSLERVHATILHYLCNTEGLNKAPSGLAADLQPAASLGRPLCGDGGFRLPPAAGGYSPPCTPQTASYHAAERRGFLAHEMTEESCMSRLTATGTIIIR